TGMWRLSRADKQGTFLRRESASGPQINEGHGIPDPVTARITERLRTPGVFTKYRRQHLTLYDGATFCVLLDAVRHETKCTGLGVAVGARAGTRCMIVLFPGGFNGSSSCQFRPNLTRHG